MYEENTRAQLPEVCGVKSEVQCSGGKTKKERDRVRKRESNKSSEAEEDRKFGEWRGRENWGFEEDSGSVGGNAGRPARDNRGAG